MDSVISGSIDLLNVFPMSHADDQNDQLSVFNLVDDPMVGYA
jgi:hypothetical protein